MKINSKTIIYTYLLLYISLLVGFYFNEDFAGGYKIDYFIYENVVVEFQRNLKNSLLFYEKFDIDTSPFFILLISFIHQISFDESYARFLILNFSLLLPYIFYLCIKTKYEKQNQYLLSLIPVIIFISPYYRSSSIWMGPENVSIIFFLLSIYFFLKHEKDRDNLTFIILNAFFLAFTAYIRPIYSIFSIYFFLKFYFNIKFSKNLIYYVLLNILLSLPAFYYVFIMEINFFWSALVNEVSLSKYVNQLAVTISLIFFYSIPFLFFQYSNFLNIKKYNFTNLVFSFLYVYLLLSFFNYGEYFADVVYGGGIFYKISNLIFKSNYFFYLATLIALNVIIISFFKDNKIIDKFFNFIILFILITLEPDGFYFHETYDPLLYIVFLLMVNNQQFLSFIEKLNIQKLITLFSFVIIFYCITVFKHLFFFIPQG